MHNPRAGRRITSVNLFDQVCKVEILNKDEPDFENLRKMKGLALRPDQINLKNPETHFTFLHHFAFRGDIELLTWALRNGADINAQNTMKKTPLHLAAEQNQATAVKVLLESGADLMPKTLAGFTPLHLAVLNGHEDVVRTLLEHGGVDEHADSVHGTPVEMASAGKNSKIQEMLAEYTNYGMLQAALFSVPMTPCMSVGDMGEGPISRSQSGILSGSIQSSQLYRSQSGAAAQQPTLSRSCSETLAHSLKSSLGSQKGLLVF